MLNDLKWIRRLATTRIQKPGHHQLARQSGKRESSASPVKCTLRHMNQVNCRERPLAGCRWNAEAKLLRRSLLRIMPLYSSQARPSRPLSSSIIFFKPLTFKTCDTRWRMTNPQLVKPQIKCVQAFCYYCNKLRWQQRSQLWFVEWNCEDTSLKGQMNHSWASHLDVHTSYGQHPWMPQIIERIPRWKLLVFWRGSPRINWHATPLCFLWGVFPEVAWRYMNLLWKCPMCWYTTKQLLHCIATPPEGTVVWRKLFLGHLWSFPSGEFFLLPVMDAEWQLEKSSMLPVFVQIRAYNWPLELQCRIMNIARKPKQKTWHACYETRILNICSKHVLRKNLINCDDVSANEMKKISLATETNADDGTRKEWRNWTLFGNNVSFIHSSSNGAQRN